MGRKKKDELTTEGAIDAEVREVKGKKLPRASAPKKEVKNHFPEPKVEELKEEPKILTPAEYFETIKGKMETTTSENIKRLYDVTMKKLKKYMITGQASAAKELFAKCLYLEKEAQLVDKGITTFVYRNEVDNFIDNVADDVVVVCELSSYDREIPDEIIDVVADTKDIFDQFYIVFTDYTGEKRSKVEDKKKEKDPILFGSIFTDGKVSDKLYFIGDWVDEFCDLTLDKMIEKISEKEGKEQTEIQFDINDLSSLEKIEEALYGKVNKVSSLKVNKVK